MNPTKLSDKIMKNSLSLVIFILAVAALSLAVFKTAESFYKDVEQLTPYQKMIQYATVHTCNRTKLIGVVWWQCDNGWWEEIELFDLANGKYRVGGSESVGKTKPTGETDGSAATN